MVDPAVPGAERASLLTLLGVRAHRRAEPRASVALAGTGCALAVAGVLLLAGDAGDGRGSFNRAPGVLLSALVLAAGLLVLHQRPRGPVATAGAVAVALGIPATIGFLLVGGSDGRLDAVIGLSTLAWAGAYLTGPARGRPVLLGLGAFGAWSTVMQLVDSGFSFGLAVWPLGLSGSARSCTFDPGTGMSRCDGGGYGRLGGFGGGPDLATVGALSIGIGIAYLLLSRHLDRSGRGGMSTPFVAVGLLAFAQGVGVMAIELGLRPGGVLVAAAGIGLSLFGALVVRRFTTWFGAIVTVVGVAMLLLPDVDSAAVAGLLLLLGGLGVVAAAQLLALRLGEPDEMACPGASDGPAPAPGPPVVTRPEPPRPPDPGPPPVAAPVTAPVAKRVAPKKSPTKPSPTKQSPTKQSPTKQSPTKRPTKQSPAKKAAPRKRPPTA